MSNDFMKDYEEKRQESLKNARAELKKFCELLTPFKVDFVELEYDGCGDSGAIERVNFISGVTQYKGRLPRNKFSSAWSKEKIDFKEALEETCYQFLPDGWEINEGSFGKLVIDVTKKSIRVEHNERYEDTHYTEEDIKL